MSYAVVKGIQIGIAILAAILFGNGCVVAFNHLPVWWFEDIQEDGTKVLPEALRDQGDGYRQRLTSTPWKAVFVLYFGMTGIYLALREGPAYEVAVLVVFALVLEIAISDAKYRIVPDQLIILLAVSAIGFVRFHEEWWEPVAGAAIGALLILVVWGVGRILAKKDIIGGADLKFHIAMGLVAGRSGVAIIFILTQLFIGIYGLYRILVRHPERSKSVPMLPFAAAAITVYYLFLWDVLSLILL